MRARVVCSEALGLAGVTALFAAVAVWPTGDGDLPPPPSQAPSQRAVAAARIAVEWHPRVQLHQFIDPSLVRRVNGPDADEVPTYWLPAHLEATAFTAPAK